MRKSLIQTHVNKETCHLRYLQFYSNQTTIGVLSNLKPNSLHFLKNIIHVDSSNAICQPKTQNHHQSSNCSLPHPARIEKQTQRSMQRQKHFTIGALREENVIKKSEKPQTLFQEATGKVKVNWDHLLSPNISGT